MSEQTSVWALPPELLLHVFRSLALRDLGVAAQVCSHWKLLAYDKALWLPLDFSQDFWRQQEDLNKAFPRIVDMVCSDVVELNLSYCDHNLNEPALLAISKCVNVRWLSLAWCRQTTDEVLKAITHNCPNITHLDLRGCAQLSMHALETLERLPNLESLLLDYCVLPNPRALARLTAQCQSLQQLSTFFLRFSQVTRFNVWADYALGCFPSKLVDCDVMDHDGSGGDDDDTNNYGDRNDDGRKKPHGAGSLVLNRVTLETDLWKQAYLQSFDTTTAPHIQIAAAAERARKEGKLVLLCIGLCKYMQVPADWTIRIEHYLSHNPLLWKKLNETFVWLHLDEATARDDESIPIQADDDEYEQLQEGAIHDWLRLIKSLPEWPYMFVLDTEGKLISRQTTGPLERYERYDHHTLFRFIDNWRRFLVTGEKPLPITGTFADVEPAYQIFSANDHWDWLVEYEAEEVSDGEEAADPAHADDDDDVDDEANRD